MEHVAGIRFSINSGGHLRLRVGDLAWVLLLALCTLLPNAGFVGLCLLILHKRAVNLSALSIGIDFLQIISLFGQFGFKLVCTQLGSTCSSHSPPAFTAGTLKFALSLSCSWPPALRSLFTASSAASLNDQIRKPLRGFNLRHLSSWGGTVMGAS